MYIDDNYSVGGSCSGNACTNTITETYLKAANMQSEQHIPWENESCAPREKCYVRKNDSHCAIKWYHIRFHHTYDEITLLNMPYWINRTILSFNVRKPMEFKQSVENRSGQSSVCCCTRCVIPHSLCNPFVGCVRAERLARSNQQWWRWESGVLRSWLVSCTWNHSLANEFYPAASVLKQLHTKCYHKRQDTLGEFWTVLVIHWLHGII